jgi:exopolysaccharide biosynthesis polyprenyl glycosylphosphotransferase
MGLRMSERKLLLTVVDVLFLCFALILAVSLRTNLLPNIGAVLLSAKWYVTLVVVWAVMANVFDVYSLARSADPGSSFWAAAGAAGLTSLVYLGIPWLTPPLANRSYGILFIFVAVVSVSLWRILYARLFVQPVFQHRALVIGAGASGHALVSAIQNVGPTRSANPFLGTGNTIVGFIDDDPNRQGETVVGIPVIGDSENLVDLVESLEVDELVIAITDSTRISPNLYEAILDCREKGLPIVTMPTIYERLTGRVAIEHAGLNIELATGQSDSAFLRMFNIVKRIVDIMGALAGIMFLAVITPFVALGNILGSPGPLFFRQERLGRAGRIISVIKFRSMVPSAEEQSGAVWATENDSRVTSFGRWLRHTHMDELPQFINVLRGEMSIVGPRPERPEFVEQLSKSVPFYRARHSVRPGITGWAQIHQDYGDSFSLAVEKLEYDFYYLKRAGFRLDTVIMLRTITKVLGFQGR